ncbi:DedA family protein [Acetivibrio ethanolgignens]|uniref:VTT domain-containing protein n=1 Tax=Acetivibrio ethanolgignens TaxID=290052 RepID=A0A0V8QDQ4_9FIRM|nr:DedA family protein [Acetivibrio ethanolgignens]KSV58712.1 hypothetical protein ASU35_02605 [Acetivibrio ethanolgignens]
MSELISLFCEYGIFAMFVLILAEYACFPVSSEIILPFAGAFAASQGISFFLLLPVSILAGLIGTSICYFLGLKGGTRLLTWISTRFPSTENALHSSCQTFEKYGLFAVGIGRVIPLCRTYIAFVAGAFHQPYPSFFAASFAGISVWNSLLIGVGYFFRENWPLISGYYTQYKDTLLLILIVFLFLFLFHRIIRDYF